MAEKKILLIEDEPDQVTMLKIRLEANGFKVISATDGGIGIKKAYAEKPDIILLDLLLPNIDGFHVCKCLKEDNKTSAIPIIIVTGSDMKNIERVCEECGADDFLRKPYESRELVKKATKLLKKR
jgi:DNA-binding response OmpR family regulator